MSTGSNLPQVWPPGALEHLEGCPACGSPRAELLFAGLEDHLFHVGGRWDLHRCLACGVAFLNPRLSPAHIHEAYVGYHTHDLSRPVGLRARAREFIYSGSARRAYAARRSRWNAWIEWLLDRCLPHHAEGVKRLGSMLPPAGSGRRLLDVGCGSGTYLRLAWQAGWQVTGVETDPAACRAARSRGVPVVQVGLPCTTLPGESFDVVTLTHVIEHLHDPRPALREIRRLLAPGGLVMITTPNLDAYGLEVFGRCWRGLEPPRHLVLYTPSSLGGLLRDAGFSTIEVKERSHDPRPFYFRESLAIASGTAASAVSAADLEASLDAASRVNDPRRDEQFTVWARRP
jgi:SAM-dependent methyltransferase